MSEPKDIKDLMVERLIKQGLTAADAGDAITACIAADDDPDRWAQVTEDDAVLAQVWELVEGEVAWYGAVPIKYHLHLLKTLRVLIFLAGGRECGTPSPQMCAPNKRVRSESGKIELVFDYGLPKRLITPEGSYQITGDMRRPDIKLLGTFLNDVFLMEELVPVRDDEETKSTRYLSYELDYSGPLIAISLREIRGEVDELREILIEAGGALPELGTVYPSESGKLEIHFDYGTVFKVTTLEGSYLFDASIAQPREQFFWSLLNRHFEIEVLKPKRDDRQRGETQDFTMADYLIQNSGPIIALSVATIIYEGKATNEENAQAEAISARGGQGSPNPGGTFHIDGVGWVRIHWLANNEALSVPGFEETRTILLPKPFQVRLVGAEKRGGANVMPRVGPTNPHEWKL